MNATTYVALVRAANVGGTGALPMAVLKAACEAAGGARARTYIASGNLVFAHGSPEAEVKAALQQHLALATGRSISVIVRDAKDMAAMLAGNPYADRPGNRVHAIVLDEEPPTDAIARATGRTDELLTLGRRAIYVFYPGGAGASKLRIPAAKGGTARNMNTIAKLVEMAAMT